MEKVHYENDYFKAMDSLEIISSFTNKFYNLPVNEHFYREIDISDLHLIEKLKKEINSNELIRNISILSLKIFFRKSDKPIKELIRIKPNGELDKLRKSNYVSEKCSPEELEYYYNEIGRTFREELFV